MTSVQSVEDKLIINGEMFYSVRANMRDKKPSEEIIEKIEELLNRGADINAYDGNDNNNTILHIAIQKDEKDIVTYLLNKDPNLFSIEDIQKALKLALQRDTVSGKQIAELLSTKFLTGNTTNETNKKVISEDKPQKQAEYQLCNINYTFDKREGTSGVGGLYETKLLSLILYRSLHDKDIKQFYLATNISDIGGFDDVCYRYDDVVCFMQCKHKENTNKEKINVFSIRNSNNKNFFLGKYFESFLKIRTKIDTSSEDPLFKGNFDKINSVFILYTPAKEDFDTRFKIHDRICNKLHDIINTGDDEIDVTTTGIFQYKFEVYDLDILTQHIKYKELNILGKIFLKYIFSNNVKGMMECEIIRKYQPALAQSVITFTKDTVLSNNNKRNAKEQNIQINSNNNNILVGKFRDEFFDSENIYLKKLKSIFCNEIIFSHSPKKYKMDELRQKIQDIANNTSCETIAQLIGAPLKFDDKNCRLLIDITKLPKPMLKSNDIEEFMHVLQNVQVTKSMIDEAVYLAGKDKLLALTFQLPKSFDNTDLKIKNNRRLNFITGIFLDLIKYSAKKNKDAKIITIDKNVVGQGKIPAVSNLDSNGIGGAVGNLLHFDEQTQLFTINTKTELAENAKYVLNKIKELVGEDVSEYRFNVMTDEFPRITFDIYEYDRVIAREFFSKLWFYTNQAQEESVENIIKQEISMRTTSDIKSNQFHFHVQSDAIFLQFHDKVQKWWKSPTDTFYLTKGTNFYEEAKKDIIDRPILTVLSLMFMRIVQTFNVEFNSNAISNCTLLEYIEKRKHQYYNILSDAVILTAAKIMQCEKLQNNTIYLHLDYIHVLPVDDYEAMIRELALLKEATIVIISDAPVTEGLKDTLLDIFNAYTKHDKKFENNIIIIITNEQLQMEIENYHYVTVKDENINLCHLTSESQKHVLNTYEVTYQGKKVKLNSLIDDTSKHFINAKFLLSILKNQEVVIGHEIKNHTYDHIKKHYVHRSLHRNGEKYFINTLFDIDEKTVLISSKPGIGKKVHMTHISHQTKQIDSKVWIVTIDMVIYIKELEKMRDDSIDNILPALLKTVLKSPPEDIELFEINTETVAIINDDMRNISFELQLFVHFYNQNNVFFLFHGLNNIYPRYTTEALALFTKLKNANKHLWITGNCSAINNLTETFGSPYLLKSFPHTKEKGLLDRFWAINIKLDKFINKQYHNVRIYLDYILNIFNKKFLIENHTDRIKLVFLSDALHILYLTLLDYFKDETDSLSWTYIREKIKRKWNIHSYTAIDRYLQNVNEDDSLELKGIPFFKYVAENYFTLHISDEFYIHLNDNTVLEKSHAFMKVLNFYKQFLLRNIIDVCNGKTVVGPVRSWLCNNFLNKHNNMVIYAIYKRDDLANILTSSEINEIEKTISNTESETTGTDPIDAFIYNEPRNLLLLAEYYLQETVAAILPNIKNLNLSYIKLDSIWNVIVNVILAISPRALRNAFKYRVKYDPGPPGANFMENINNIRFELVPKDHYSLEDDDDLDFAINEALSKIINVLINFIRTNISDDIEDIIMTVLQKKITVLEDLEIPSSVLSGIIFGNDNFDGETIVDLLNVFQIGNDYNEKLKEMIVKQAEIITKKVVEISGNNKNVVKLVEAVPLLLPELIRAVFKSIDNTDMT